MRRRQKAVSSAVGLLAAASHLVVVLALVVLLPDYSVGNSANNWWVMQQIGAERLLTAAVAQSMAHILRLLWHRELVNLLCHILQLVSIANPSPPMDLPPLHLVLA